MSNQIQTTVNKPFDKTESHQHDLNDQEKQAVYNDQSSSLNLSLEFKNDQHQQKENSDKFSLNNLKKHLKENQFNIKCAEGFINYEMLSESQKKELLEYCKYEPLLLEAEQWLKSQNIKDPNLLKQHERFQILINYKSFNKKIQNFNSYHKKKKTKRDQDINSEVTFSDVLSLPSQQTGTSLKNNDIQSIQINTNQPLPQLNFNEEDVVELREEEEAMKKWETLIKTCLDAEYQQRTVILKNHFLYDYHDFIRQLKRTSQERPFQHFFSNMFQIIQDMEQGFEQTHLFIYGCSFYELELFQHNQKEIIKSILTQSLTQLKQDQLQTQAFGLLKLMFVNNISFDETDSLLLSQFLESYPLVWELFTNFLKVKPFNIRREIANRLPKSGFCFNQAFITVLKENSGYHFSRIPDSYRKLLIDLCVYSNSQEQDEMKSLISMLATQVSTYETPLNQANFQILLEDLIKELKARSPLWVRQLSKIEKKLESLIKGILEQRINDVNEISSFLKGDESKLQEYLSSAASIKTITQEDIKKIINRFKELNSNNDFIQQFKLQEFNKQTQELLNKIQLTFKRELHITQRICLFFLLSNLSCQFQLVNFGIGNGKSLLCAVLSILINFILKKPVIILCKSKYLPYRDYKKFKTMMRNCDLSCSHDEILKEGITYLNEKTFQKFWNKEEQRKLMLNSFLIIDEYTWYIFDESSTKNMKTKIDYLKQFKNVIGFSGTTLIKDEVDSLNLAFGICEIKFPSMKDMNLQQIVQYENIVLTEQLTWKQTILDKAIEYSKKAPVIIIASKEESNALRLLFKKNAFTDLAKLLKNKEYPEMQNIIEKQFAQKCNEFSYGIYLLNEELGIGTDFPTSFEIEAQGGICLLITSIFGTKSTEQIKGRVGRLQNKGQLQFIIKAEKNISYDNYIQLQTNIIDDKKIKNLEQLLNLLEQDKNKSLNSDLNQINDFYLSFFEDIQNESKDNDIQQQEILNNSITDSMSNKQIDDQLMLHIDEKIQDENYFEINKKQDQILYSESQIITRSQQIQNKLNNKEEEKEEEEKEEEKEQKQLNQTFHFQLDSQESKRKKKKRKNQIINYKKSPPIQVSDLEAETIRELNIQNMEKKQEGDLKEF